MARSRWLNCSPLAVPTLLTLCCLVLPAEAQSTADAEISSETTIQWIDKLTSQHASTDCAILRHSTRLCVSQLHIPEDYPGRSGLQVAWVTFPSAGILLDITTTKMDLPLPSRDGEIARLSGGFWKGSHQEPEPDGLVVENGEIKGDRADWLNPKTGKPEGGVIFQGKGAKRISIVPIDKLPPTIEIDTALQSKPVLIENGQIAIHDSPTDREPWNRACVGLDTKGDIVLVVATGPAHRALRQYEFAYLLTKLRNYGTRVDIALGMDGAFAPSLTVRKPKVMVGSDFANTVSFIHFLELK